MHSIWYLFNLDSWRNNTIVFNRNYFVGTSLIVGNNAAILICNAEASGHAVLSSVLTNSAKPQATETLSVICSNGSSDFLEEIQYIPSTKGILTK